MFIRKLRNGNATACVACVDVDVLIRLCPSRSNNLVKNNVMANFLDPPANKCVPRVKGFHRSVPMAVDAVTVPKILSCSRTMLLSFCVLGIWCHKKCLRKGAFGSCFVGNVYGCLLVCMPFSRASKIYSHYNKSLIISIYTSY